MPSATDTLPTFGFPNQPSPPAQAPPARPTPLPKRPKGRWFVGALLLTACAFAGYQVWNSFFRYRAYGTITGRVVELSAPWEGVVAHFHVREGDRVREGQLLLTLENTELRHRHARLGDELRTAQATLEAETAKLKWQAAFHFDQSQGVAARYMELWGQLLQEESQLDKLRGELEAARQLQDRRAVAPLEVDRLRYDVQGQEQKVEKLQTALDQLKKQADVAGTLLACNGDLPSTLMKDGEDQLKEPTARITALQAERARLAEQLAQGRVVAPANGLVVKLHRFAGERCRAAEPVVSLLEEGSLQVVLYVPQKASASLGPGSEVSLALEPYPEPLTGTVVQVGDRYEPAPEHLKRHYSAGQRLLPVFVRPRPEASRWMTLRIDGVVKLP